MDTLRLVDEGLDHEPPQCTYGWKVHEEHRNRKRRVRFHSPRSMVANALPTHTVLKGAHHIGVVIQLEALAEIMGKPRPRFPNEMLKDTLA